MATCPTRREILEDRRDKLLNAIELAWTAYDELIADNTTRYEFDSNEGRQEANNRKLSDLSKEIDRLYARLDDVCRALDGTGIAAMKLRRKPSGYYGYGGTIIV